VSFGSDQDTNESLRHATGDKADKWLTEQKYNKRLCFNYKRCDNLGQHVVCGINTSKRDNFSINHKRICSRSYFHLTSLQTSCGIGLACFTKTTEKIDMQRKKLSDIFKSLKARFFHLLFVFTER